MKCSVAVHTTGGKRLRFKKGTEGESRVRKKPRSE